MYAYLDHVDDGESISCGAVFFNCFTSKIKDAEFIIYKYKKTCKKNTFENPYVNLFPIIYKKEIKDGVILEGSLENMDKLFLITCCHYKLGCPVVRICKNPIKNGFSLIRKQIDPRPLYCYCKGGGDSFFKIGLKMMKGNLRIPILFKELRSRCRYKLYSD